MEKTESREIIGKIFVNAFRIIAFISVGHFRRGMFLERSENSKASAAILGAKVIGEEFL